MRVVKHKVVLVLMSQIEVDVERSAVHCCVWPLFGVDLGGVQRLGATLHVSTSSPNGSS